MRTSRLSLSLVLAIVLVFLTVGSSLAADSDKRAGRFLTATLTGAAEVPGPGDPDGTGTASIVINPGQEEICFTLTVANIAPATAAHIHIGTTTQAGPVVVGLTPPTSGSSSGCVTVSRELARAIIQDPSLYYINVHNAAFPSGAIRGQLSK
jgi:hypothetical protein